MKAELELKQSAALGEGPFWDEESRQLYWVNIDGKQLNQYDPTKKENRAIDFTKRVCAVVKREAGGLLLALEDGLYTYDNDSLTPVVQPELGEGDRFNDGKCDPAGRFWAGTMSTKGVKEKYALYCLDVNQRTFEQKVTSVTISNGLAWDQERAKMYYIDTPTQIISAYDYNESTGAISNRTVSYSFANKQGSPDGMAIDQEGMLWVALWGGWGVARINPLSGEWIDTVEVPAAQVTSCAFGGEDYQTLFITTAATGLNEEQREEQKLAGSLFSVRTEVRGSKPHLYKG